jgi:hypothetical protein
MSKIPNPGAKRATRITRALVTRKAPFVAWWLPPQLVADWAAFYTRKGHREMTLIAAGNGIDRDLPKEELAVALARKTIELTQYDQH